MSDGRIRPVESFLEDALLALMMAKDRLELFQHDEQEIARVKLLIRAVNKTRQEITNGEKH